MPTYEYACTSCGHQFEAVQSFSDPSLTTCPTCGGNLRKVFGNVGIVLKGSGFYKTDSRNGANGGAKTKAKESAESSSSSSSETSAKSESAGKSETSAKSESAGKSDAGSGSSSPSSSKDAKKSPASAGS